MARNGVHSGGRTKAKYYKVWDKETGVYKGIWRIGARQHRIHSLFIYERVGEEKEEEFNKIRQQNQIKRAIDKQNLERYSDYLK